jgi:hypothetical protein
VARRAAPNEDRTQVTLTWVISGSNLASVASSQHGPHRRYRRLLLRSCAHSYSAFLEAYKACRRARDPEGIHSPMSATLQVKMSLLPRSFPPGRSTLRRARLAPVLPRELAVSSLCKTLPSALRFAEVMDEPDKTRGSLEQILPRGGQGQAHVTFAKLAECAAWRDGHVLAFDQGTG